MRTCKVCQVPKEGSEFYGAHLTCKACQKQAAQEKYAQDPQYRQNKVEGVHRYYRANKKLVMKQRTAWAKKNPQKVHASHRKDILKRHYGITSGDYQKMLREQGGVCAICGSPPIQKYLDVDHNHTTGKVRGLLCHLCNMGLGSFRDSRSLLSSAMNYLNQYGENSI